MSDDAILPNFLIVGASKAGTTSLYYWLKQHPDVFLPRVKEPCYFAPQYQMRVTDWERYVSLYGAGRGKKAIGEASTVYLESPESAGLIMDTLGKVRIIILLRNPANRAFSYYCWMLMEGYESILPFEKALALEDKRVHSEAFRKKNPMGYWLSYAYFASGLYYEQVKRYLDLFGDNVKALLYEDLVNQPHTLYRDVCGFLGISTDFQPLFKAHNPSRIPRSVTLQFMLRRIYHSVGRWRWLKRPVHRAISRLIDQNTALGYKPVLAPATRRMLQEEFRSDVQQLSSLIGRDLSSWLE
jgi:hypothetical protein